MTLATITPKRQIGAFTADATFEEQHSDELAITEHPVEQGAAITDHAYKRPSALTLRLGWSNASQQAGGDDAYVRTIYAKLLALQASRVPIDVVTGKRSYSNMLIAAIALTTDETSEFALFVTVTLREIIIVQTQTTSVPPAAVHADPAKTAPIESLGTKQPAPATPSPPTAPPPGGTG